MFGVSVFPLLEGIRVILFCLVEDAFVLIMAERVHVSQSEFILRTKLDIFKVN